jgi:UDP-GlcNAc:undecaprenyl-phosphate GlcNAc-1-phosphate transferase
MNYSLFQYLSLGFVALIIVGLITPLIRKYAIHINAMDKPSSQHKTHIEPVPYLGGLAIIIGIVVTTYSAILVTGFSRENFDLATYVLTPAIAMAVMGLVDDLKGLAPWPRLITQTVTATLIAILLVSTDTLGIQFGNRIVDIAVTILWIVGICNSINFFDNLDGGATGTIAVIATFIFFIAFDRGQFLVGALSIVMAGSTLGFLIWNKSPAKIYMGDAGALFLGILVSVLTIRVSPGIKPNFLSLSIPVLLIAVPILDTCVAVTSRLNNNISPFTGGRDHLSHRLIRKGLSRKRAAIALWCLTGLFGVIASSIYRWPDSLGLFLLSLAALIWGGLFIFFIKIPRAD